MTEEAPIIVLNGVTYYLPRPVWKFMAKLITERDHWKSIAEGRNDVERH